MAERGRPKQWRTYLRATIADRLSRLPDVPLRMACIAAIQATREPSKDKQNWRDSLSEVENVRRAVYRLRLAPDLNVMPSPGLMLKASGKLHDSTAMAKAEREYREACKKYRQALRRVAETSGVAK